MLSKKKTDPVLLTPDNSAELAQIHYLLKKSSEWASPGHQAEGFINTGNLDRAIECLEAHVKTLEQLQGRLIKVVGEQRDLESAVA